MMRRGGRFLLVFLGLLALFIFFWKKIVGLDTASSEESKWIKLELDSASYQRMLTFRRGDKGRLLIYVNYSRPSYQERIWLIDIDSIRSLGNGVCKAPYLDKGYAAHGEGRGSTKELPEFSNEPNSLCSSQGFFKLAEFYTTTTGKDPAYRLDGLDPTNSNMRRRGVVLHPRSEVDLFVKVFRGSWLPWRAKMYIPFGLSISQGCIVVEHRYFDIVRKYVEEGYNIYGYVH